MLIKNRDDSTRDLTELRALMAHPQASRSIRERIDQEIRRIQAGKRGEHDAAYEIDFHHKNSNKWAVLHDLRIEWQGRTAQIDHLLINRCLDIWVCESKSFAQGVAINEHGEFTRFYERTPTGIPSPLQQNRKHIEVLKSLLTSSAFRLPTRLGMALQPNYESVVLIANGARITRPRAAVVGLDRVVHTDQFRSLIEKSIDNWSTLDVLGSAFKIVSEATLEEFACQIAALHRPIAFDWHARFGLPRHDPADAAPRAPALQAAPDNVVGLGGAVSRNRADLPSRPIATPSSARAAEPDLPKTDPHLDRLSTSKLAAARGGIGTKRMLDLLVEAGYLLADGDGHRLTPKALEAGAVHIEKSRYGPYFLWPVGLTLPAVR